MLINQLAQAALLLAGSARAAWPDGPFTTSGRWIQNSAGDQVNYAGVNWPGAADTMVPEGLQYQSIEAIVSRIKDAGMNVVRLTWAIEMVDQIYDNGGKDVTIQTAFSDAMGDAGADVLQQVLANNPSFSESTTRLDVFDAIADECARQQVYVHLDNHVSKAVWCCSPFDGNAWWGDIYFDADNWVRGLSYMADHGTAWPNLMSMALRNELRQPLNDTELYLQSYTWQDWYGHMQDGAEAVHKANPDVLIFLSGIDSDTTVNPLVNGTALEPGTQIFDPNDFGNGFADKLVLELHVYDNIGGEGESNCTALAESLVGLGFMGLIDGAANQMPVVMTEFGFPQTAAGTADDAYAGCLMNFIGDRKIGWMIWVISGSYYIREGVQDSDESWGLLAHDWSAWRLPSFVDGMLQPLVETTVSDDPPAVVDQLPPGSSADDRNTGQSEADGDGDNGGSGAPARGRSGDSAWIALVIALFVGLQ